MSEPRRTISHGTVAAASGILFLALALGSPDARTAQGGVILILAGVAWASLVVFGVALRAAALRAAPAGGGHVHGIATDLILAMVLLVGAFGMVATAMSVAPSMARGVDEGLAVGADAASLALWARLSEVTANVLVEAATFWRGLLLIAVGAAALRARILPRWLAAVSIVLGGLALAASVAFLETPAVDALQVVGFGTMVAFYLWVPIAGIAVAWSTRSVTASDAAAIPVLAATPSAGQGVDRASG